MTTPAHFASTREYISHLEDLGFWQPYIAEILKRHGLTVPGEETVAGTGGTYPTYIYGDVVVKLFGHLPSWRGGHVAERAAQNLLATDSAIAAPRLLGEGQLFDDPAAPWPYLITTRMPALLPLQDIATLDDLAAELFGV
jgi:hypothetical protein